MDAEQMQAHMARLDDCVYLRHAVNDFGIVGLAVFDCEGELEMFSNDRPEVFDYIWSRELKLVYLH